MSSETNSKLITDVFVDGAKRGWSIAISSMLPNVLMAFIIIQILKQTHILDFIGRVFDPVMTIWGLPGEASMVLAAAILSMGGASGVVVSLFADNIVDARAIAVLLPSIYLMGSLVQYMGRVLGVLNISPRLYLWLYLICFVNALIAMTIMSIII